MHTSLLLLVLLISAEADVDTAQKALDRATAAARGAIVKAPSYVAAKQKFDAASAALGKAGAGAKDSVQAKMKAKAELDAEIKRLVAIEPGVVAAALDLEKARHKAREAEQARIAAEEKRRAAPAEQLRKNTLRYQQLVASKLEQKESLPMDRAFRVGDEVSLELVRSKPHQYVDKLFTVTGLIRADDYYGFGYSDAKSTHYSLSFRPIDSKAQVGNSVSVYQLRSYRSDDIVRVIDACEDIKSTGAPLIRLRLTISSTYAKTFDGAVELYEVRDWQFYDLAAKAWGPWWSETQRK